MAVLTGTEVLKQVEAGRIRIDPFEPSLVNVDGVSVDVRLGDTILFAKPNVILHPGEDCSEAFSEYGNGHSGVWLLRPGFFYLASTVERIGSDFYAPILHGKSTNARCSLTVHQTAGVAEPGWFDTLTLEITVAVPVMVTAGMRVAQVVFETTEGEIVPYKGRYVGQAGPTPPRAEVKR